jgi:5-methylcytosine-specific restriction endonuclease McrA
MSQSIIARYVNPWKYRREQEEQQRVAAIRLRDGDECRRCRRPMRFDLPGGHDQGATVQQVLFETEGGAGNLDNLCLTHRRCNAAAADNTAEVSERIRRKNEAALFTKARKRA